MRAAHRLRLGSIRQGQDGGQGIRRYLLSAAAVRLRTGQQYTGAGELQRECVPSSADVSPGESSAAGRDAEGERLSDQPTGSVFDPLAAGNSAGNLPEHGAGSEF